MKTAGKRKITIGWVTQVFDDAGKCVEQEFTAGDEVNYEDHNGNIIEEWNDYYPFYMIQPPMTVILDRIVSRIAAKYDLPPMSVEDSDVMERLVELQRLIVT